MQAAGPVKNGGINRCFNSIMIFLHCVLHSQICFFFCSSVSITALADLNILFIMTAKEYHGRPFYSVDSTAFRLQKLQTEGRSHAHIGADSIWAMGTMAPTAKKLWVDAPSCPHENFVM